MIMEMNYDVLHPGDREKLRGLGECLCDASLGRFENRWFATVRYLVGQLMVMTRYDLDASGADRVALELVAMADPRLGADEMAAQAYRYIILGDKGPTHGVGGLSVLERLIAAGFGSCIPSPLQRREMRRRLAADA